MVRCTFLDKQDKDLWLPILFDLLYDNMHAITPSGLTYGEKKKQWLSNVSPALDKAPRQIVMCFAGDALAGYIQYYTRGELLMVEEVQIRKSYQKTPVFYCLCKYLCLNLPPEIAYMEAFADERNRYSRKLMDRLGMKQIADDTASPYVHLRGPADGIKKYFQ